MLNEVKEFYIDAIDKLYANPHAGHALSRKCLKAAEKARNQILKAANANQQEYSVVFTSGGTEANNLALLGKKLKPGQEIITCSAEHPSIINTVKEIEKNGVKVHFLPLNCDGSADIQNIAEFINSNTALISLNLLHNETGGILDMERLADIIYGTEIHIHIDAVQAFGKVDIDIDGWGVDSMSIAGHKFHGPNSSGALIYQKTSAPETLIFGGGQQDGLRSGTLDAAAAATLGKAAELNASQKTKKIQSISKLNKLCRELLHSLSDKQNQAIELEIISSPKASPYILLVNFKNMQGAILMRSLSALNVIVGTGSACSADSKVISPALKSLGLNDQSGFGVLRISFGWQNTEEDVKNFIYRLQQIILDY